MRAKDRLGLADYINYSLLGAVALVMLYPLYYVLICSISNPEALAASHVYLAPIGPNLEGFMTVIESNRILVAYRNSIFYTVLGTSCTLFSSLLAGYVLASPRFRWRNAVSLFLGLNLFFEPGLIPTYIIYSHYGLVNSIWSMVVPWAFSFWFIIIIRTHIKSIPSEMIDAAIADGANDIRILFSIVVPLSGAILATCAVFVAVAIWNNYFVPLIYLHKIDLQPLPLLLQRILIEANVRDIGSEMRGIRTLQDIGFLEEVKMATIVAAIGPILLVYPFAQKYFVKGVLIGSVKE